jgi:hypothetical protein
MKPAKGIYEVIEVGDKDKFTNPPDKPGGLRKYFNPIVNSLSETMLWHC